MESVISISILEENSISSKTLSMTRVNAPSPPGNPFREFKAGSCDARAGFAFPVGMDACASIPRCTLAT